MERQVKKLQSNYRKRKWAHAEKELVKVLDEKVEDAIQALLKVMGQDKITSEPIVQALDMQ